MELPKDLMCGIFFRLQCRDVVSCGGVCRAWYNLLSDPNFSTYYARFSPLPTVLVTQHHDRSDYFFLIHIDANGEFIRRPIKPKVPRSSEPRTIVKVVGSCNGLVFLLLRNFNYPHTTEQVYVCNPLLGGGCYALRKFFRVNKLVGCVEYKLGFVPPTNKIKLLSIGFDGDGRVLEAHILTFREDDKWRKLKDPLTLLFHFSNGICFNGAYHWVAEDENVDWICTFDYGEEKCGRISKPPDLLQLSYGTRMTVLNYHLCLVDCINRFDEMIIWTMKEYGVAESWSKYILLRSWFPFVHLRSLSPLAVLPNGDILFSKFFGCSLISFSPETKKCTKVQFRNAHPVIDTSFATMCAPRFYALEEEVSRRKHLGTQTVWSGALFYVLAGFLFPFSVNRIGGFVHKFSDKLGLQTAAASSL